MNKTKIEWCSVTWNPLSGCKHNCDFCYARRIAERFRGKAFPNGFEPTYRFEKLNEPVKEKRPQKIFVCSMGDLFGVWVDRNFILQVIETARKCPQHTFMFLTKNPSRYGEFFFPDNCWLGTSVSNEAQYKVRSEDLLSAVRDSETACPKYGATFISIEPLHGPIDLGKGIMPDWIIIGAETGPRKNKMKPEKEWVQNIIDQARDCKVPVFIKDNVEWYYKIQEFPTIH